MIIVNSNTGTFQSSGIYFLVWVSVGVVGALVSFYLWHVGIILTGAYGSYVYATPLSFSRYHKATVGEFFMIFWHHPTDTPSCFV
jgi:hypothetical protein